jgi:hypothetical protein
MNSRQHQKTIPVKINLDLSEKLDRKVLYDQIMRDVRLDLKDEDMITQITIEQLVKNYISSPNFKVY